MKDWLDLFFVDEDSASVDEIYYNPDSNSEGQFVVNTFLFTDIIEAKDRLQSKTEEGKLKLNVGDFFSLLEEISFQVLFDVEGSSGVPKSVLEKVMTRPSFEGVNAKTAIGLILIAQDWMKSIGEEIKTEDVVVYE